MMKRKPKRRSQRLHLLYYEQIHAVAPAIILEKEQKSTNNK